MKKIKKDLDYYLNLPYEIVVRKNPENEGGGYGAFIPLFKKIAFFFGDGDSPEEALKDLKEAFSATLESMIEDGDYIPEPDPAKSLINPDPKSEKAIRLNITLPERLVEIIDKKAKELCLNRSALIAHLARNAYLES